MERLHSLTPGWLLGTEHWKVGGRLDTCSMGLLIDGPSLSWFGVIYACRLPFVLVQASKRAC